MLARCEAQIGYRELVPSLQVATAKPTAGLESGVALPAQSIQLIPHTAGSVAFMVLTPRGGPP